MKKLYKIGDISKLYNISNDILRYYEKIGLLIPDVRGENGYRYYSESQLWKLNNIRSLRNLGVSLNEIIDFLNTRSIKKNKRNDKVPAKKNRWKFERIIEIKRGVRIKKENIRYFEHFSDYEIPRIKYYPKRYILLKNGKFKDENEINLELKKLKRKSEGDNDFIFTESEIGTVIKLEEWEKGNYSDYIGTFIITNEIKENFLDEGEYLTYFFSGDYINLSKHYKKLKEFIRENNYRVCGNIIELYHIEMHITENKEEYVTEIQIPLEKKWKKLYNMK